MSAAFLAAKKETASASDEHRKEEVFLLKKRAIRRAFAEGCRAAAEETLDRLCRARGYLLAQINPVCLNAQRPRQRALFIHSAQRIATYRLEQYYLLDSDFTTFPDASNTFVSPISFPMEYSLLITTWPCSAAM